MYGGREAGKGWSIVIYILTLCYYYNYRVLCCREIQKSIADSSHKLFKDRIEANQYFSNHYEITRDSIKGKNGSEILFSGLLSHTVESVKGFEGVDICWVDEAQRISKRSFEILDPTIRKSNSYFIMSMNPELSDDYIYKNFILADRQDVIKKEVLFTDNTFRTGATESSRLFMLENSYDDYLNVWLGKCTSNSEVSVFKGKWEIIDELPEAYYNNQVKCDYGIDWGFSNDPTVLIESFDYDSCLYISSCIYEYHLEIDEYETAFLKLRDDIKEKLLIADSSNPASISYLQKRGWNVTGAKKPKNSIEDGIKYLRGYKRIYIMSGLTDVINEFRLHKHLTDRRTGEKLRGFEDKNNHAIDGLRYSKENKMLQKRYMKRELAEWI